MINILLFVTSLFSFRPSQVAQIQPCVWPNKCAVEAPVTAQVQTCVWPNRCARGV